MDEKILIVIIAGSFTLLGSLITVINDIFKNIIKQYINDYKYFKECERNFLKILLTLNIILHHNSLIENKTLENADVTIIKTLIEQHIANIYENMKLVESNIRDINSRRKIKKYHNILMQLYNYQTLITLLSKAEPKIFVDKIIDYTTDLVLEIAKYDK